MAEEQRPVVRTRGTALPPGSGASISDVAIPRIGRRCANSRHPTSSDPKRLYCRVPSEFLACPLLVPPAKRKTNGVQEIGLSQCASRTSPQQSG